VNKLNNANINYLKIPIKHRVPHKTLSWATCGPRVRPLIQHNETGKIRSHITLQQVSQTDQSQPVNIRGGLCWLTECLTGTFRLTTRDAGTKPLNRDCPG